MSNCKTFESPTTMTKNIALCDRIGVCLPIVHFIYNARYELNCCCIPPFVLPCVLDRDAEQHNLLRDCGVPLHDGLSGRRLLRHHLPQRASVHGHGSATRDCRSDHEVTNLVPLTLYRSDGVCSAICHV